MEDKGCWQDTVHPKTLHVGQQSHQWVWSYGYHLSPIFSRLRASDKWLRPKGSTHFTSYFGRQMVVSIPFLIYQVPRSDPDPQVSFARVDLKVSHQLNSSKWSRLLLRMLWLLTTMATVVPMSLLELRIKSL